jgi:type II secretory pathway pseudopilin PulG
MEMLRVIAIIGILAALLLPNVSSAKKRAQRTACMNNLRQINLGVRMYSDDSSDNPGPTNSPALYFSGYKNWMKSYVGSAKIG